jgi:hypothetical protein
MYGRAQGSGERPAPRSAQGSGLRGWQNHASLCVHCRHQSQLLVGASLFQQCRSFPTAWNRRRHLLHGGSTARHRDQTLAVGTCLYALGNRHPASSITAKCLNLNSLITQRVLRVWGQGVANVNPPARPHSRTDFQLVLKREGQRRQSGLGLVLLPYYRGALGWYHRLCLVAGERLSLLVPSSESRGTSSRRARRARCPDF